MMKKYYSQRNNPQKLTLDGLFTKFESLFKLLREKDYFKEEHGSYYSSSVPKEIKLKAMLALDFQPFPISEWDNEKLTEDNLFDTIEYLYDQISKPGERVDMISESGYNYWDYESYDKEAGKKEYRDYVNNFLLRYRDGYELTVAGQILSGGSHGVQNILAADLPIFGDKSIDLKVERAVLKWRNRQLSLDERREAIRELADVFEWLKTSRKLKEALNKKDELILFEIANKFAIRHHNPDQIQNYDKNIWYSWMFHFYLATYHAVVRMMAKQKN